LSSVRKRSKASVPNSEPLLFISHKHEDAEIADAVGRFVENISGGEVKVFQSSSSKSAGPRAGKPLGQELRNALWNAGVVVLIYTSQDKDWSWCMYECGVAAYPPEPDTKVIVLQCSKDRPEVFLDAVRVVAENEESIKAFAKCFSDKEFFPGLGRPVTNMTETQLLQRATELHQKLQTVYDPPEKWHAWPFLRVQFTEGLIDGLMDADVATHIRQIQEALLTQATVVGEANGALQLFDRRDLPASAKLYDLFGDEHTQSHDECTDWLNVLAAQVAHTIKNQIPGIEWKLMAHKSNFEYGHYPVVSRAKRESGVIELDVYFVRAPVDKSTN
jgi:hypothetical protein